MKLSLRRHETYRRNCWRPAQPRGRQSVPSVTTNERMLTMMRKLFALIMTLALLAGTATAEGLFAGLVPTPTPTPVVKVAPSYAIMAKEKSTETQLEDGSLQQTYANVSQADFNAFGVYLGQIGYSLPSHEYVGDNALAADVVKDDIAFKIQYDWSLQQLIVIYPEGVRAQRIEIADPLVGYTKLDPTSSFSDNYIIKVESGTALGSAYISTTASDWKRTHKDGAYILNVGYRNESAKSQDPSVLVSNVTLHYITGNGHYRYMASASRPRDNIAPLDIGHVFCWADKVPYDALFNRDGITAVTFNFLGYNTPFVIYVNNPNEDIR